MESFLQPLKSSLWIALFISVILVGCSIFLLDFYSPFGRFLRIKKNTTICWQDKLDKNGEQLNFGEAMWFVWGVLLNSGVCESKFIYF